MSQITEFQAQVYDQCKRIPKGQFSTYKSISDHIHSSPRAVGQALKKNPFAPTVPCHRVIASDFTLGGFYGQMNDGRKIEMLESEGVTFVDGKVSEHDRKKLFDFSVKEL
jgi:methylated-DNA-[protein]-cysteine S-methyltransferase